MVVSCCVKKCHNRKDRESDRTFHCIPLATTQKGAEQHELTTRRRIAWLGQLRLKGFTFETKARRFVCSDHFVKGRPAYVRDISDPDWKPTLKLGHEDVEQAAFPGYIRLQKQKHQAAVVQLDRVSGVKRKYKYVKQSAPVPEVLTDGAISTRSRQKEECCFKSCSKKKAKLLAGDDSGTKTFFPFPREETRCRQWAKNCGRPELIQKSAIQLRLEGWRVCSDHFDSSQFQFSSCSKKRLTPEAVPSPVLKTMTQANKSQAKKFTTGHKRPRLTEAEKGPLPEVKLEMDYAEDPTVCWASTHAGPEVTESADTEPLGMATQPQNVDWEPLDIKLEPQNFVCEPLGIESKPQVCASAPADIKTKAQDCDWKPPEIKSEPQDSECSPVQVSSVVLSEDPQVTDIKSEPVFFEDPRLGCGSDVHNRFDRGQHQESPSVIPSAVRQQSPSVTPSVIPSAVRQQSPSVIPSVTPSVTPSAVRQQCPSVTPPVIPTELTLANHDYQGWMVSVDSQFDDSDVEDDSNDDDDDSPSLAEVKRTIKQEPVDSNDDHDDDDDDKGASSLAEVEQNIKQEPTDNASE